MSWLFQKASSVLNCKCYENFTCAQTRDQGLPNYIFYFDSDHNSQYHRNIRIEIPNSYRARKMSFFHLCKLCQLYYLYIIIYTDTLIQERTHTLRTYVFIHLYWTYSWKILILRQVSLFSLVFMNVFMQKISLPLKFQCLLVFSIIYGYMTTTSWSVFLRPIRCVRKKGY